MDGLITAKTVHNLHTLHLTSCIGDRPVVFSLPETARTDPVVTGMVLHQQSKAGRGQAVSETGRVLVHITESFTIQVAEGSSSRDPTLRVVFENELLRLALTQGWSGGRFNSIVEMVNQESRTDDSSEDCCRPGKYPGDLPGWNKKYN